MPKPLLSVLLLAFFALPASHAAITDWNVYIELNEDKTSDWTVNLLFNETATKSDYFVLATLTDYSVFADGMPVSCDFERDSGASIICDSIQTRNLTYKFKTATVATDILQNFRLFTQRLPATQLTDRYVVTVRLPFGSVLADAGRLPPGIKTFEPEFGRQYSDGRFIFITWSVDKPVLGETLDVSVVYEQLGQVSGIQLSAFVVIIAGLVAAFFFIIYFMFMRHTPIKDILPVLTDGERKVMEILLREKGSVDQRQIVKETDFSKAKVSRVISDLVGRGVIEKVSKGRKNLIRLKKAVKTEKLAESAPAENKSQSRAFSA